MSGEGEAVALGVGAVVAAPAAIAAAGAALGVAAVVGAAAVTAGAAAAGVAGAAAGLVGAGAGALQAMKDCGTAAIMAKDAVKEAIGDCADELRDLSLAQAHKAQEAYEKLRDQLNQMDEQKKQDFRDKLLSSIDEKALGVPKADLSKNDLSELADLASVSFHLNKIDSLLYQMEQEGLDVDAERTETEALRDALHEQLKKGQGCGDADPKAMDIISRIGKRLEQEALDSAALEPCRKEVLMIEKHIADPYLGVFESDLLDIMKSDPKVDEAEEELNRLRSLVVGFSIKARSIEFASSESYEEMRKYIASVREKVLEDVHVSEKIRFIEELLPVIESRYKDCLADNRALLEQKNQYDQYYLALASLAAELGEEKPEYRFNAEDPSASIAETLLEVGKKGALVDKRRAQENIHKAIAESMRQRRWSLVAKTTQMAEGVKFITSTYHVENGNVIQFTTSEDGEVVYGISGVHTPGVSMDRLSIYETQRKVCAQRAAIFKEIEERTGTTLNEQFNDEPSIEHVYEIELEGVIPGAQARLVEAKEKAAKRGGGAGAGQHRHAGDDDE